MAQVMQINRHAFSELDVFHAGPFVGYFRFHRKYAHGFIVVYFKLLVFMRLKNGAPQFYNRHNLRQKALIPTSRATSGSTRLTT